MENKPNFSSFFIIAAILFLIAATSIEQRAAEQNFCDDLIGNKTPMIEPADLFRDFPAVKFGMSFADAKKILNEKNLRPVGFRDSQAELAWDGKFNQMSGRGTVLFKEGGGIYEIAVGIYAMEKRRQVFESLKRKIIARHGATKEIVDETDGISYVWRLKNGFIIELRQLKDINNPVVDVHWVKSV